MIKPKCYNCKNAGKQFKIEKLTHLHCDKAEYQELARTGDLSGWESLRVFSDTCDKHEFKIKVK